MKRVCLSVLVSLCGVASAQATDLNLSVKSGASTSIAVAPGASVPYTITGTLSDGASDGLAMFTFNLSLPGAVLTPAATPTTSPMNHFATPLGVTNPNGYGGAVKVGALLQVGGAQNTINNTLAPIPSGSVLTGVAQPAAPAVLATGTLTAPNVVGTYNLVVTSVFANALVAGQTGLPFWKVEPANPGSIQNLTIQVGAITPSISTVSVLAAQSQVMTIDAGPANAGRTYWMLGSLASSSPGIPLSGGLTLPLDPDGYFQYMRTHPNSAILSNSFGTLDAQGRSTVVFTPNQRFIASNPVHHAFILMNPVSFVSEAEPCTVVN